MGPRPGRAATAHRDSRFGPRVSARAVRRANPRAGNATGLLAALVGALYPIPGPALCYNSLNFGVQEALAVDMRTPAHVKAYLQQHHLPGRVHLFDQDTPSVEAAARAAGIAPEQVVKTLLFFVAGQPVVVITIGPQRVDYRALARHFGVGRKKVRLATAAQVQAHTGYPVGAVPPLAHAHPPHAVLMDPAVLAQPVIWAGGGGMNALLEMPSAALRAATAAQVVPVRRMDPAPAAGDGS